MHCLFMFVEKYWYLINCSDYGVSVIAVIPELDLQSGKVTNEKSISALQ